MARVQWGCGSELLIGRVGQSVRLSKEQRFHADADERTMARDESQGEEAIQNEAERAAWGLAVVCFSETMERAGPELASWLRRNSNVAAPGLHQELAKMRAEMKGVERPESDVEGYWDMVATLTALGWVSEAAELLEAHSARVRHIERGSADREARLIHLLVDLVGQEPSLEEAGGDVHELRANRREWLSAARRLADDDAQLLCLCPEATSHGAQRLLATLLDSDCAMGESRTWLQGCVAMAYRGGDLLKPSEIDALRDEKGSDLLNERSEDFFQACARREPQQAIAAASRGFAPWLPPLVAERTETVSYHARMAIRRSIPAYGGCTQAEVFRLDWASALVASEGGLPDALRVLEGCPVHGKSVLRAFLCCHPVRSESEAAEVSVSAKEKGPLRLAELALRAWSWRECSSSGMLGCMRACSHSSDGAMARAVCRRLLSYIASSEDPIECATKQFEGISSVIELAEGLGIELKGLRSLWLAAKSGGDARHLRDALASVERSEDFSGLAQNALDGFAHSGASAAGSEMSIPPSQEPLATALLASLQVHADSVPSEQKEALQAALAKERAYEVL